MTTPYREGKPLTDIIPPDRRRQKTIALVVGGMIVGAIAIEGARGAFNREDTPPPPPPPTSWNAGDVLPGSLSAEEISTVVAREGAELRTTCFRGRRDRALVNVDVVISAGGTVDSATARGDEPTVTACVEEAVKGWRFPKHAAPTATTRIPIRFERT